jgi:hypothetical protein
VFQHLDLLQIQQLNDTSRNPKIRQNWHIGLYQCNEHTPQNLIYTH